MKEPTKTLPQRLPLIDHTDAPPAVAEAFKLLPEINVFRAMAGASTLYPAYAAYIALLFKDMVLEKALERMIVLHVAQQSNCFYAWRQNVVVAKSVGVTEAQIAALESADILADCFDDSQKAAFAFTDEVIKLVEVSDGTYTEAKKHFSDRAIVEMLYVIGTYMFVARVLLTGRVPLDAEPAKSPQ